MATDVQLMKEIKQLRESGANDAIRKKIGSIIWDATKYLEICQKNQLESFMEVTGDALASIRKARRLYRELPKLKITKEHGE